MEEDRVARVRLAQLHLYVSHHLSDKYVAPLLTVVAACLLTTWVPHWQAMLWALIELGIVAVYIGTYTAFRRADPQPDAEPRWRMRIALSHGAHMLAWSSIPLWAWQPGQFESLIFIMLIHVGLISLTVAMSNPHRFLLITDLAPPTLALLLPPFLSAGWFNFGLSMLGLFYTLLMLLVGLKIHGSTSEALLLRQRNEELIAELERQATRDGLTGVANRRQFLASGKAEILRSQRFHHDMALLILDIDRFKQVNDSYGHQAGDKVIRAVVAACECSLRTGDSIGRLGGEEFGIVLPETGTAAAEQTAERLRETVAALRVDIGAAIIRPTVSVGVSLLKPGEDTLSTLLHRADLAMYRAKQAGRNRVEMDADGTSALGAILPA